jgi:hypothetical protein
MSDFVDDDIREEDTLAPLVAGLDGDDVGENDGEIDLTEEDPEETSDLI